MPIRIVIPGEPSAKGRPHFVKKTGIAITPAKTRTREGIVATVAMDAMNGRPPLSEPIIVSIKAVMAVPASWPKKKREAALAGQILPAKRPDLDNLLKLVTDGMNEIVYTDDALIVELRARKVYGETPKTIVEVWLDAERKAPAVAA